MPDDALSALPLRIHRHSETKMIHTASDEVLEHLWYAIEEERCVRSRDDLGADLDDESFLTAIHELVASRAITEELQLSETGVARARRIVRRHRLAEVLFHEALGTERGEAEGGGGEVEHLFAEAVVAGVCTFLGPPPVCPHGK